MNNVLFGITKRHPKLLMALLVLLFFSLLALIMFPCQHAELREAIDRKDYDKAREYVRGDVQDIYCGNMPNDTAMAIWADRWQKEPERALEGCRSQYLFFHPEAACQLGDAHEDLCGGMLQDSASLANPERFAILASAALVNPVLMTRMKDKVAAIGENRLLALSKGNGRVYAVADSTYERIGAWVQALRILQRDFGIFGNGEESFYPGSRDWMTTLMENRRKTERPLSLDEADLFCALDSAWATSAIGETGGYSCRRRCGGYFAKKECYDVLVDSREAITRVYKTIRIGRRIWTAQNMGFGSVSEDTTLSSGERWCIQRHYAKRRCNGVNRERSYYTWNVAQTVCPEGWHIPSRAEWKAIVNAVNGNGNKLVAKGGCDTCENGVSEDAYGFDARYTGYYPLQATYAMQIGHSAWWWTSDKNGDVAWAYRLKDNGELKEEQKQLNVGMAVRCVKD